MNQILGHKFIIRDWGGKYTVNFKSEPSYPLYHLASCLRIAAQLDVPINKDKIFWNILLINFGFEEVHLTYRGYFPEFNSLENLQRFVILLNSHLLINIRDESFRS